MASVFTRIVRGEIPCYKVGETENCLAFLDAFPLRKGHTLVIPKKETDHLFDLGEAEYSELLLFARKVAAGIRKAIPSKRISLQVIGLEVPHAHIHLIPINTMNDCDFSQPKLKFSPEEFTQIARSIAAEI